MRPLSDIRSDIAATRGKMKAISDKAGGVLTHAEASAFNTFERELLGYEAEIDRYNSMMAAVAREIQGGDGKLAATASTQAAYASLGEFARTGDRAALGFHAAALTEAPDSAGVAVPHELADIIVSTQKKHDPLRTVARVVAVATTASKFRQPIFHGDLDAGWVGESDSRPVGSMDALAAVEFPDAEVFANIPISAWVDEDSKIGEFVVTEIVKQFSRTEGQAFVSGTGTKQPLGFLTSPQATTDDATRPLGTVQTIVAGTGGVTITADLLVELLYALKPAYRAASTWVMNSKTLAAVRKLKDSTGAFLWQPALMAGQPELLLGRPVVELENMPDVAAGAIPVAVGDWNEGYYILDRTQMILRDPFTAKPNVLFYARKRVSGAVVDSNAIKLLKLAAS